MFKPPMNVAAPVHEDRNTTCITTLNSAELRSLVIGGHCCTLIGHPRVALRRFAQWWSLQASSADRLWSPCCKDVSVTRWFGDSDMCLLKEEAVAMSCGLTKANYSHCPLKKRPVYITDNLDELTGDAATFSIQSEPENLSTKPEDIQMTTFKKVGASQREPLSHFISYENREMNHQFLISKSPQVVDHLFSINCENVFKTKKLNTPSGQSHDNPPSAMHHASMCCPSPLRRDSAPDEFKLHDCYPSTVSSEKLSSPYRSWDSTILHNYRPNVSTSVPKSCTFYHEIDSCGLSPTSSTLSPLHCSYLATSSSLKDSVVLSSPGSVASSEGSSNESKEYGKKTRDKRTVFLYQCLFCSKSYSTASGLSNHQDLHRTPKSIESTAEKSFSCEFCERVYATSGALKMHIRTHTLPCKCVICGKAFSRPWLLQGHIRTHTGEKPFSCPFCDRAFADRSNLRAHLQTHSEVKRYSCHNCGNYFSRMSLLTKHREIGCFPLYESSEDHTIID